MPKKVSSATLRAQLKKRQAKTIAKRLALKDSVAGRNVKAKVKSKLAAKKALAKQNSAKAAKSAKSSKPQKRPAVAPQKTKAPKPQERLVVKRPAAQLQSCPTSDNSVGPHSPAFDGSAGVGRPRKSLATLVKRPACLPVSPVLEEVAKPRAFPKSDNPFAWLQREDKLRAEHESMMQALRQEGNETEAKFRLEIQMQREVQFASHAKAKLETQRLVEELRQKTVNEIERRAHAEGRAHAMAELWRRGGWLGRSIISENQRRERISGSGRHALSDTNSMAGDEGTPAPPSPNEEEIATAALEEAGLRGVPVVKVTGSKPEGAGDRSGQGLGGAASPLKPRGVWGSSNTGTEAQDADQRMTTPAEDARVPVSSRRHHHSALGRALAPPPQPGCVAETSRFDAEGSDRRSAIKGNINLGCRTAKGGGKATQPIEKTLPRAKAATPTPPAPAAPVTLGQQAALIGEEL